MNDINELLKSEKYILLFSMGLTLIAMLLFEILSNGSQEMNIELMIIPTLSLLLGPFAVLGFVIVEGIKLFIINPNDMSSNLITIFLLFLGNMLIWKLWYSIMNQEGYEIPNLNSLTNMIKLFAVFLIYLIICHILFSAFAKGNPAIDQIYQNMIVLFPLSMIIILLGIHISIKYKIPLYTPKRQLKQFLPNKIYLIILILAIIIGMVNIQLISSPKYSVMLTALIILLLIIYLTNPMTGTHQIKEKMELNLINKINFSILLILLIIMLVITLPILFLIPDYLKINDIINIFSGISEQFFTLILIPFLIYLYYLEKNMMKPINKLSKSLSKDINNKEDYQNLKNDLNSINANNELKTLAQSLLKMENDLNQYSKQLIKVTSQKERFETELKLAHEIQNSMIPKNFEEYNDGEECEIWGLMEPAREVAGDFYDFFKIDDDNIGFVIGDVSGKGITASLIMVKSMTLIQDYAKHNEDLSEVFYEVNNLLCEGNVETLFVTCWLGKINFKTKKLSYVNAGHNPPLIKQNENFEYLDIEPGLILAAMEDMPYETYELQLKSGDAIILYTDGITEANSDYEEFYGEERLKNTINKHKNDDLEKIITSVKKDINEFCGTPEQFDDMTMFAIKLK